MVGNACNAHRRHSFPETSTKHSGVWWVVETVATRSVSREVDVWDVPITKGKAEIVELEAPRGVVPQSQSYLQKAR